MRMKTNNIIGQNVEAPLSQVYCHYPSAKGPLMQFPCIAFNQRGELFFPLTRPGSPQNAITVMSVPVENMYETLPIIKASGFYTSETVPEPLLDGYMNMGITPPTALTGEPLLRIRIDGKTGRVSVPKPTFE